MPHHRLCWAPYGPSGTDDGYPVLSSPATVPPHTPLRRVVSHSETISAPCQCRTLRRGLEAVYGPYSTSAPLHTTQHERGDTEHSTTEARTSPLARVVMVTRGCDLNSVHEIEITIGVCYNAGEGNRLLPTTGPGEGVRPHEHAREGPRTYHTPCRSRTTGGVCNQISPGSEDRGRRPSGQVRWS